MSLLEVLGVIVAAGVLGGGANYVSREKPEPDPDADGARKEFRWSELLRPLVLGVAASALVPLFLYMVSSDLLNRLMSENGEGEPADVLVFAGFCLVAAISSRAFIDSLTQRVLRDVSEAKSMASRAETKADQAEAEADSIIASLAEPSDEELDHEAQSIAMEYRGTLEAMEHPDFRFRTQEGVARQAGQSVDQVTEHLEMLAEKGLVREARGKKGKMWTLTPEGRSALKTNLPGA